MSENYIQYNDAGDATAFVGRDAVSTYRVAMLASSCEMYAKFKMIPTRGVGATRLLQLASEITGKRYKKGGHMEAAADLRLTLQGLKASLEHRNQRGETI